MSDVVARVTVVLLLGLACLLAARRASSALRHWICFLALVSALAMPSLMRWMPAWELPLLAAGPAAARAPSSWTVDAAIVAWIAGTALLLLRLARRTRAAHRICRSAAPIAPAGWTAAASRVRRELGLRRAVELRLRNDIDVPFAWGLLHPVVVLPAAAAGWGPGRLRAVLIHELSHVRRGDCWTNLLAEFACAVYWFHPVAWTLSRRMRFEREAACDDRVLAAGARPSGYATLLLHTVRSARPGRLAMVPALGFRLGLERRIQSLLQARRSRRVLTSDHHFWCAATALALMLPIATARLVPAEAAVPTPPPERIAAAPRPALPPAPRPVAQPPAEARPVPESAGSTARPEAPRRRRFLLAFHFEFHIGVVDPRAPR